MGAGRKTETYTLESQYAYGTMCGRNLKKGDLCGVIFGCKFSTIKECYAKKLFGLPAPHMAYIQNIDPGLTLFLFNYSDRTLHGIFEAASEGKLNIDPKAWSPNGTDPSPYPAQVKIRVRVRCEPLVEEKFRPVIAENYKDEKMFGFELDRGQTNKLLRLFSPSPSVRAPSTSKDIAPSTSRKPIPASIGEVGATRVDKWSNLFKSSDDSSDNKGKESQQESANREGSRIVSLGKIRGGEVAVAASYSSVAASKGDKSPWSSSASQAIRPPSKEDSGEDTYSEIDWDAVSSFKVHLDGLNKILEEPGDKEGFKRFDGNTGFASSSFSGLNHWEDERITWEFEEGNIDKSQCGSSYVSAMTGDDIEDDKVKHHHVDDSKMELGSLTFVDILNEILCEVKELKLTQIKQDEKMISLQMELLESRREILRLKARYGSS